MVCGAVAHTPILHPVVCSGSNVSDRAWHLSWLGALFAAAAWWASARWWCARWSCLADEGVVVVLWCAPSWPGVPQLTQRQTEELNLAVLEYLVHGGERFSATADAFMRDTGLPRPASSDGATLRPACATFLPFAWPPQSRPPPARVRARFNVQHLVHTCVRACVCGHRRGFWPACCACVCNDGRPLPLPVASGRPPPPPRVGPGRCPRRPADASGSRTGQLVRKWTCVVRLSRRVKDLEAEVDRLKKEVESAERSGGGGGRAASSALTGACVRAYTCVCVCVCV